MSNFSESGQPLVLHVRTVTGFGGGPEKTILNSPRFLRGLGYDSVCAYMHPPDDEGIEQLRQRSRDAGAELLSVPDRGIWDLRVLKQLIGYCRRQRVAIWHGHDYKSNLFGLIASRFWHMKLVTTVHGWVQHTRRTPLYYLIDRRCLPYYDSVVCVSDDLYRSSLQCGVSPSKCHYVHNGIDVDEFRRVSRGVDWSPQSGKPLVLGAMGRLSEEKGFDLLIRAVAQLQTQGLNCHLRIAGDGKLANHLKQLADELKCAARVELLGQVSDVKSFFENLDVFVLSSRREGLPNVLLEAMAMEVPVVATRVAGIPALIKSNETGILIDSESVSELKEGIRQLAVDPVKRDRLAAAARCSVESGFSFRQRMERITAVYNQLLGRDIEISNLLATE